MGLSALSEQSVRRLNLKHGTEFVHASARNSGMIFGTKADATCWHFDRKTGETMQSSRLGTFAERLKEKLEAEDGR